MAYQKGFDADIEFYAESTYGEGLYNPATGDTMWRVSNLINSITLTNNNNAEVLFSIGDVSGADIILKQKEYTLRIEYILQEVGSLSESLLYYGITRNSSNDLDSVVFLIQYDDTYYECKGGICNSVEISGDVGEPIKVTQEFYFSDVTTSSTDPLSSLTNLSHSSALTGDYATYGGADVSRSSVTIGYGTRSFSVTVNNNAERVFAVGSDKPKTIVAGKMDISGTIDVYIDEGGLTQWEWVNDTPTTAHSIKVDFGITTPDYVQFSDTMFTSIDLPMNNSDAIVVTGLPFIAEDVTLA